MSDAPDKKWNEIIILIGGGLCLTAEEAAAAIAAAAAAARGSNFQMLPLTKFFSTARALGKN